MAHLRLLDEIDSAQAKACLVKYLGNKYDIDMEDVICKDFHSILARLITDRGLTVGKIPRDSIWTAEAFDGDSIDCLYKRSGPSLFLAVARVVLEQEVWKRGDPVFESDHRVDSKLMIEVPDRLYKIRDKYSLSGYWNNDDGWTVNGDETVFTEQEKEDLRLPVDGVWEYVGFQQGADRDPTTSYYEDRNNSGRASLTAHR